MSAAVASRTVVSELSLPRKRELFLRSSLREIAGTTFVSFAV